MLFDPDCLWGSCSACGRLGAAPVCAGSVPKSERIVVWRGADNVEGEKVGARPCARRRSRICSLRDSTTDPYTEYAYVPSLYFCLLLHYAHYDT